MVASWLRKDRNYLWNSGCRETQWARFSSKNWKFRGNFWNFFRHTVFLNHSSHTAIIIVLIQSSKTISNFDSLRLDNMLHLTNFGNSCYPKFLLFPKKNLSATLSNNSLPKIIDNSLPNYARSCMILISNYIWSQLYLLDERPANDDYSMKTPFYTMSEDAKSIDETYKFEKIERGRYFYFAKKRDVTNSMELSEIFIYRLPIFNN